MIDLPQPLMPLAAYKQFIVYLLQPSTSRPGKTDKFPCDFRTGRVVSAHQSEYWTDYKTAIAASIQFGGNYGIGFTFTDQDPFWFLDIDDCLQPDNTWSPIAIELCTMFAGCAVEVSQSGKGLHIFGSGRPPEHAAKNEALGLEFYHNLRFVALSGVGAIGNAAFDATAILPTFVEKYVQPSVRVNDTGWTDCAREDWNGPEDDDELIRRAMMSTSAAASFAGKASFADLWSGDMEVLSRCYPDPARGYNSSQADAALAQHLAFWTGNNCERIQRLMEQSGLVRDKYDRDDYLPRTITKAVGMQFDVLTDKRVQAPDVVGTVTGSTFASAQTQQELFKGCVYVRDAHKIMIPGGTMLKPDQFKVHFGGYTFSMDSANEKTTRDAWEAFTQNQSYRCRRVDGTCFMPNLPHGEIVTIDHQTYVNTFYPVTIARKVGDGMPFITHLEKVLPDARDRTILLSYMAACVQHQGIKFQWAPLLQGVEGNGKTLFTRCVAQAVGTRYVHWPKASQIASNFNGWLVGKVFYGVEDIYVSKERAEIIEILKPMITGGDGIEIERKGVDQISSDICGNFMFNSNHRDAIAKTKNDRRFCVMFSAQQSYADIIRDGMDAAYFSKLYNWLRKDGYAIVSELLHTFPIPDEFNPATSCQRAPTTSSTMAAIEASTGSVEQEILEAVSEGLPGFCGGWISSIMLDRLFEKLGGAKRISRAKRKQMLLDLGYDYHPALPDGRVNNQVLPDLSKPRLFIHKNSPALMLTCAGEVAKSYEQSNNYLFQHH